MQTDFRNAIFQAESVAHLRNFEREILPATTYAKFLYFLLKEHNIDVDAVLTVESQEHETFPNFLKRKSAFEKATREEMMGDAWNQTFFP